MDALRRSLSIHRLRSTKGENQTNPKDEPNQVSSEPCPSIDTFVIPRRTRLPSDATRKPDTFDINVARKLLSLDGTISESKYLTRSASQYLDTAPDPRSGPLHRTSTSANLRRDAALSDPLSSRTPSGPPSYARGALALSKFHNASEYNCYVEEYRRLAQRYGLEFLPISPEGTQFEEDGIQIQKSQPKTWLKRKLIRSGSPENGHRNTHLSRKASMSSIFGRHPKLEMKQRPLDEICRLGGVSLLHMPSSYSAVGLYIPTCLAATGKYLIDHGRRTPGIFRIPGQASIIYLLHEHFLSQLEAAARSGHIQTTICAPVLPISLKFTVQDIASTFKKLLSDLPGGILGSIDLFKVLREIESKNFGQTLKSASERVLKSHLIALAVLSQTERRVSLISAVFGILALLKGDEDNESNASWTLSTARFMGPESMSSEALGVVYAPLLIGDLLASIEVNNFDDDISYFSDSSPPKRGWLFKTPKPTTYPGKRSEIAKSLERTRIAASIIEMLVQYWTEIVRRMRFIQATSKQTGFPKSASNLDVQYLAPRQERESTINTYRRPFDEPLILPYNKTRATPPSSKNPFLVVPARSSSKVSLWHMSSTDFDPKSLSRSASLSVLTQHCPLAEQNHTAKIKNSKSRYPGPSTGLEFDSPSKRGGERYPVDISSAIGGTAWWELNAHGTHVNANVGRRFAETQVEREKENFRMTSSGTTVITPRKSLIANEFICTDDDVPISRTAQRPATPRQTSEEQSDVKFCNLNSKTEAERQDLAEIESAENPEGISSSVESRKSSLVSSFDSSSSITSEEPGVQALENHVTPKNGFDGIIIAPNPALDDMSPYKAPAVMISSEHYGQPETQGTAVRLNQRPRESSLSVSIRQSPSRIPRPVHDLTILSQSKSPKLIINRRTSVADIVAPLREGGARPMQASPHTQMQASPLSTYSDPRSNGSSKDGKTPRASRGPSILRKPIAPSAARGGNLPQGSEPPVARHIKFKRAGDLSSTSESSNDPFVTVSTTPNTKVGTLFSENRRLRMDLDSRNEEIVQLKHQLDAIRNLNDCGTLSERLRIAERDLKAWKRRAEWAEKHLLGNGLQGQAANSRGGV